MIALEEDLESGVGPVPDPIASLVGARFLCLLACMFERNETVMS